MAHAMHRISAGRLLKADIAHQVYGHENKCKDLHGHEYWFEVFTRGESLDSIGRVVDYSMIKSIIGSWIDLNWDHGTILWEKDPLAEWFSRRTVVAEVSEEEDEEYDHQRVISPLFGKKFFALPFNPTAENIASHLLKVSNELMAGKDLDVEVYKIICWETSSCFAIAEL